MLLMLLTLLVANSMPRMSLATLTTATLTSTLSSRRLEILMEEFLVDTLMLTPTESSSRFSILLMEQDSVLLTLVSPLLLSMTELLPPSTQSFPLPPLTPPRLPRLRLLILLLLLLLLPLLRGRDVRQDLPTDLELPTPPMPSPMLMLGMLLGMLVFPTLMAFPTTDKLLTGKFKFCAIFVFKCSMCVMNIGGDK